MENDHIEKLLRLAYLEGQISAQRAYDRTLFRNRMSSHPLNKLRLEVMRRLEETAATRGDPIFLSSTIGTFLKHFRSQNALQIKDILERLCLTRAFYQKLEEDRISPLRVSVQIWKVVEKVFGVPPIALGRMMYRTQRVVTLKPTSKTRSANDTPRSILSTQYPGSIEVLLRRINSK